MVLYNKNCQETSRTLFSKHFLAKVRERKWFRDDQGYVASGGYNSTRFRLHHFLKGKPPQGLVTDHINRNKLDNRDENLRFVDKSTNGLNGKLSKNNKSGTNNVYWSDRNKFWRVQARINGKTIQLGQSKNKIEAVQIKKLYEKENQL